MLYTAPNHPLLNLLYSSIVISSPKHITEMTSEGDSASIHTMESDPAWEYNNLEEDDSVTCLFCNKVSKGGIKEGKKHQIGGFRNVTACSLCPQDVKDKLKAFIIKQKSKKSVAVDLDFKQDGLGEDEDDKLEILGKKRNGVGSSGQEKRMTSKVDSSSIQSTESDPIWEYAFWEEDDRFTCLFCDKLFKGEIMEAKQHQLGGFRNVKACSLCPQEHKDKIKAFMVKQKSKKGVVDGFHDLDFDQAILGEDEEGDDDVVKMPILGKKRNGADIGGQEKRLKSNVKGPLDLFVTRSNGKSTRQSKNEEELRARAVRAIASFLYEAGISLNAVRLDSFKEMIEAIGKYGPNLKPPSYHELGGTCLKKEVANIKKWIEGHKKEWSRHGCSIMADGSDREQRTSINFLVNSSKGTVFMESVDSLSYTKSALKMLASLTSFVDRIGEANVVQVITDNGSKSVLAGKYVMATWPNLFWTPCAAQCIDLMLEDIGNIAKVKATIKRGIFLVGYIYNDWDVLNMMREFTNNKELTRTGITRFTTTYLTLKRLHNQKASLSNMFTSEKWTESVWAKETKGKRASEVVSTPSFWNNVLWILKVMGPLVRVLRLVKNEKKPAMGYIYKAMDKAKETIRSAFDKDDDCKVVYDIIDKRWECQLHHPLHAAGYYFNPELYCTNPEIEKDSEVMKGLIACITKLVRSLETQDLIMAELLTWVNQTGVFSDDLAVRARGKIAPADWWKLYGKEIPNVQALAVKVLSLGCSLSCCERNWSSSENITFIKKSRLDHKKARDLAFVKNNLTLKRRHNKDVYDPIFMEDIDYSNEWLIGKMEEKQVLENENSTKVIVANGIGAGDDEDCEVEEDFDSDGEDMEDDFEVPRANELENESFDGIKDDDVDDEGYYF
ncbi:hypothetical protein QVD17_28923 [Tagetes erecta]|uniref:HAT C-terminal dimerisation domain-containing protein n=1 Tax=Tagetes erecta TaxID=13708 RepID=A0AAD8NKU1_TARER|nr:hypothetical protein QVD17_28923 [Tagetes erecta]